MGPQSAGKKKMFIDPEMTASCLSPYGAYVFFPYVFLMFLMTWLMLLLSLSKSQWGNEEEAFSRYERRGKFTASVCMQIFMKL